MIFLIYHSPALHHELWNHGKTSRGCGELNPLYQPPSHFLLSFCPLSRPRWWPRMEISSYMERSRFCKARGVVVERIGKSYCANSYSKRTSNRICLQFSAFCPLPRPIYAPYLLQGWTQGRRQALRKKSALPRPSWCHALTRPKRASTRQIYQVLKSLGSESTAADSSNNMWISCKGKDLKHS